MGILFEDDKKAAMLRVVKHHKGDLNEIELAALASTPKFKVSFAFARRYLNELLFIGLVKEIAPPKRVSSVHRVPARYRLAVFKP